MRNVERRHFAQNSNELSDAPGLFIAHSDENILLGQRLGRRLSAEGFKVTGNYEEESGFQGIKLIPDGILLVESISDIEPIADLGAPVILLTEKVRPEEQIGALRAGAKICIPLREGEPIHIPLLAAQINSIIGKTTNNPDTVQRVPIEEKPRNLMVNNTQIDLATGRVLLDDSRKWLSETELKLLLFMAKNPNCIIPPGQIQRLVWGIDQGKDLPNAIRRLQRKFQDDSTIFEGNMKDGFRLNATIGWE